MSRPVLQGLESTFRSRIVALTVLLLLCFALIVVRLVFLQVVSGQELRAQASDQHTSVRKLEAVRGDIKIWDSFTGQPYAVATSIDKPLVYVNPTQVTDLSLLAGQLAPLLGMTPEDIIVKVSDKTKKYVPLKRQLTEDEKQKIEDLKLTGIAFDKETMRFYPEGAFLSQVLGFLGYKDDIRTGLYGLEQAFNEQLAGRAGVLAQEKDASGSWIFNTRRDRVPAINGENLVLTIDKTIQYKTELVLKDAVEKNQADSGSVIIMDPKTGAILAMATYPTFNPNEYAKVTDPAIFNNNATSSYEPGSIFKPLTMAAALNEGKVTPDTTYEDTGFLEIDDYTIKNSDPKPRGQQTMSQVLEESLNTGVIFAKDQIGNKKFLEYVKRFGFGSKTGLGISESKGDLGNLTGNIKVNYATASFGQGISVTPVQMMQAFSALANKGIMMKPYLVKARVAANGVATETQSETLGEVISPLTASQVSGMMVNVVEKGHGKRAGVLGYYVAGKTGTAQVSRKDGKGYEENNNIGSFIGYAPVEDPKFLMLVRINHPRTVQYAESTAAPAFGQLAQFMLNYFNVPPTRK